MLPGPWVVGGALQGEIECDLELEFLRSGDEIAEVLLGAEFGVDGVVTALVGADRPGRPDVVRAGDESVVRSLAVDLADRMDRGEVDDVESHRRDAWEIGGGRGEGAVPRGSVLVPAPVDRGKNSYQEPNSARRRSTNAVNAFPRVTSSRRGWARRISVTSGEKAGAIRSASGRSDRRDAATRAERGGCRAVRPWRPSRRSVRRPRGRSRVRWRPARRPSSR